MKKKSLPRSARSLSEPNPEVVLFMGSASDREVMEKASAILAEFGVSHRAIVSSAHRAHDRTVRIARSFADQGTRVFIAGAGGAAHLAGTLAAVVNRPVIAVPLASSPLRGLDALLSTAQMPAGIPVATTAIGEAGAKNAALFAIQILATANPRLERKMEAFRARLARQLLSRDARRQGRQAKGKGQVKLT